ncbi:glycosyltransferase family 2 protein [Candidatus Pacearchaeota archaeon]|nr:glycosyltransferase family 2 protein [Candidatus Pacearchaeota archaeon]
MIKHSVSVALTTYNGEKYIAEQLESIIKQSYPVYEIIISDDASKDDTVNIVKQYKKNYPNIILLENTKNVGLNQNFERAIRKCSGQLIAICDQDNIWKEDRLEKIIKNFNNEILIFSDSTIILSNGEPYKKLSEIKKYKFTSGESPKEFYYYNAIFGHNIVFRRELLNEIFPFPKTGINYDGWIAFVASCVGKISYVDKPLVYFRSHDSNITHHIPSLEDRLQKKEPKWKQRQRYNHRLVKRLEVFSGFKKIDHSERRFLNQFIYEIKKLDNSYFNIKLLLIMLLNLQKLLHRKKMFSALAKAFSQAIGVKLYRLMEILRHYKI